MSGTVPGLGYTVRHSEASDMNSGDQRRIKELFAAARKLDTKAQQALLDRECVDVPHLRVELESLLYHDKAASGLFERPAAEKLLGKAVEVSNPQPVSSESLKRIGAYGILEVLGTGGMGIVYLAEQENPNRKVALKVIRSGLVSRETQRRFEHEVEALGRLKHQGIAQIYEACMYQGTPFFAMELVEGIRFADYANKLNTRHRLALFAKVCDAVEHAHQKGVIHRDLKPDNILVEKSGQPKILDFGIARAVDSDLKSTTLQTSVGQLIGTIPYMSPEQAAGNREELDTRSDVYALGVVLYELLAGCLPYDLQQKLIHEATRIIQEESPSRLSSVNRAFRGDIETIVDKALQKEKELRYQSAGALASDIRRHLANEPISARPAGAVYRLKKFVRRNKALVMGIAVLVTGVIATSWQAVEATHARDEAQRRLVEVKMVSELQAKMLTIEPWELGTNVIAYIRYRLKEDLDSDMTPKDVKQALKDFDQLFRRISRADLGRGLLHNNILNPTNEAISREFDDRPSIEARLRLTLGKIYSDIGDYARAEAHLKDAYQTHIGTLGESHPETLVCANILVGLYSGQGRYDEAEKLCTETMANRRRAFGHQHSHTLESANALAGIYNRQGRFQEAEALLVESLDAGRHTFGEEHSLMLALVSSLASVYESQGRYGEAETLYSRVLKLSRRELGEEHGYTLVIVNNLALLYLRQGRFKDAESMCSRVLEARERLLGEDHPLTLSSKHILAMLHYHQGRYGLARKLNLEVLEARLRVLGEEHSQTANSFDNLALLYQLRGRFDEAAEFYSRALEIHKRVNKSHPDTFTAMNNLATLFQSQGRFDEAEKLHLDTLEKRRSKLGEEHPHTLNSRNNLAEFYRKQDRLDEANELHKETLKIRLRKLGKEHPDTLSSMNNQALLYMDQERYDEAEPLLKETLELRRRVLNEEHAATLSTVHSLATLYHRQGKLEQAESWFLKVFEARRRVLGEQHPDTQISKSYLLEMRIQIAQRLEKNHSAAEAAFREVLNFAIQEFGTEYFQVPRILHHLAWTLCHQQKFDEAEKKWRQAIKIGMKVVPNENSWWIATYQRDLGRCLVRLNRFAEAERQLLSGYDGLALIVGPNNPLTQETRKYLKELYDAWGKPEKASEWKARLPTKQNADEAANEGTAQKKPR
ncbi:MAG: serine/threonine-protein kinase [Phycisphaerales bacterium]|nr:serine/threonine-protein kinase [Phycisphaerales bacterium]